MHLWKNIAYNAFISICYRLFKKSCFLSLHIFFAIDMMQISSNLFILTHGPNKTNSLNMHNTNR